MKFIRGLFMLSAILLSFSCNANEIKGINDETAKMLIHHFFSEKSKLPADKYPFFITGDFNGDGIEDVAIIFIPDSKPVESNQIKVSMPWVYPSMPTGNELSASLVIFHGSKESWLSEKTRIFVLLDMSGTFETPSFELLVTRRSEDDYREHTSMIPAETSGDIIIIPTEAGIDTYIYWDNGGYVLFEPQEMP